MTPHALHSTRRTVVYSPSSAQRALPLLRSIARDAHATYLRVRARLAAFDARQRLDNITSDNSLPESVRDELGEMNAQMRELAELGARFGDPELGIVLLDGVVDGHDGFLCWKLGESDIRYWFPLDERYEDRRPIPACG